MSPQELQKALLGSGYAIAISSINLWDNKTRKRAENFYTLKTLKAGRPRRLPKVVRNYQFKRSSLPPMICQRYPYQKRLLVCWSLREWQKGNSGVITYPRYV